jgi:hypothetical protein
MRVDLSPHQVRRGRLPERIAIVLVMIVVGAIIGAALSAMRPVDGTLSGMARDVIDGPRDTHLPPLLLDMHFRSLQSLRERRRTWQEQGLRPSPAPSAVMAGLRQGQTELDVAVSLLGPSQGSAPGQLGRLLIEARGDGDFAGMRTFSLEDPLEPRLVRGLILARELMRVGALAPRWQAVGLRVNGERWGVAVAVEQPSSALLRSAHRPLGALVGWEARLPDGADLDTGDWLPQAQAARWSTSARGLQGTPLEVHTAWAQMRLDGLRAGTLTPDSVLNVEATARLLALAELTGLADGVVTWANLRWYLHPVSLRLEPVVRLGPELPGPQLQADALLPRLLASPGIRQALATIRRAEAERVLAPNAEQDLAAAFAEGWPTLETQTWGREWLTVRQRALRLMAAEQVTPERLPPPSALFLPEEVTDARQALPFALETGVPGEHALLVPPGTWHVPTTVALPQGWRLDLAAGAKLRFGPGAWLVLHGGWNASGTAEAPVELSADGTQSWGGVAVLGPYQTRIQHLQVAGANGQGRDVWQPGAVLVWLDGDVEASDVTLTSGLDQVTAIRVVGGKWSGAGVTQAGAGLAARCSGGAVITIDGSARPCTDAQEATP